MSVPQILCIPNFSTTDKTVIKAITTALKSFEVKLLHVDIGLGAGRTVLTFIGGWDVFSAAFKIVEIAVEKVDMSVHRGVHPCFGAVDVLPFVPFKNISFQELKQPVHQLSKTIAAKLEYPIFCYETVALIPNRRNLAKVRRGGYAKLKQRFETEQPDFGKPIFVAKTGATAIGLRNILVAYNIDLDTQDLKKTQEIAAYLRQKRKLGELMGVKIIAWYIPEYNFCQISTNITRPDLFGVADVFEAVKAAAQRFKVKVLGSEIIGVVPLKIIEDAAIYYNLECQTDFMAQVVDRLGLNQKHIFEPRARVIELILKDQKFLEFE